MSIYQQWEALAAKKENVLELAYLWMLKDYWWKMADEG